MIFEKYEIFNLLNTEQGLIKWSLQVYVVLWDGEVWVVFAGWVC